MPRLLRAGGWRAVAAAGSRGGIVGPQVSTAPFPLSVASGGRYLQRPNASPFLINQISCWGLAQELSSSAMRSYIDSAVAKGFNTLMVSAISNDARFAGTPPNWVGDGGGNVAPFTTAGDFSTPNSTYFTHLDDLISYASSKSALVALVPAYLGFDNTQGWQGVMVNDTDAHMTSYGQFLGNRYKNTPNIIWVVGGDTLPASGSTLESRLKHVVDGIRAAGDTHIMTAHWDGSNADGVLSVQEAQPAFSGYFGLNGYYAFQPTLTNVPGIHLTAYNASPTVPWYALDQTYEADPASPSGNDPQTIRTKAWWVMVDGGCGSSYGDEFYANLGSDPFTHRGMTEAGVWFNFWNALNWTSLIPDQTASFVTAGGTSSAARGARSASGKLGVVYSRTGASFTTDLSGFSGTVTCTYVDPTSGATSSAGSFAASGTHTFVPSTDKGNNAQGEPDWALLMTAP